MLTKCVKAKNLNNRLLCYLPVAPEETNFVQLPSKDRVAP